MSSVKPCIVEMTPGIRDAKADCDSSQRQSTLVFTRVVRKLNETQWQLENGQTGQRAFSCLTEIQAGDEVLAAPGFEQQPSFIVAILCRPINSQKIALSGTSQQAIEIRGKQVELSAEEALTLSSAKDITLHAGLGKLMLLARSWVQQVQQTLVDTCKTRIIRSTTADHYASEMNKTHARHQIMTADKEIRVDADRINMG